MSLSEIKVGAADAVACGIATDAVVPAGATLFSDCLPIGVGEVIDGAGALGAGAAGLAALSVGDSVLAGASAGFSIPGSGGGVPVSSKVIAILKVPSTITTTLAPTSSERILEVMFEEPLSPLPLSALLAPRPLPSCCWAAAACAARRAAAMKLDEETGSFGFDWMSLIALSDAAMRSDGVETAAIRAGAGLERRIRRQRGIERQRARGPSSAPGFR